MHILVKITLAVATEAQKMLNKKNESKRIKKKKKDQQNGIFLVSFPHCMYFLACCRSKIVKLLGLKNTYARTDDALFFQTECTEPTIILESPLDPLKLLIFQKHLLGKVR